MRVIRSICAILHPSNKGRRLRACVRVCRFQFARFFNPTSEYKIKFDGGTTLQCPANAPGAHLLAYYGGRRDIDELAFLAAVLRPGDVFVDVGANLGVYSVFAATIVGGGGTVHAFEPCDEARLCLERNIVENRLGNIVVHADVVGASAGRCHFSGDLGLANSASYVDDGTANASVVRLDDVLDRCAMIKIDVEGAEPLVLKGARDLIARCGPLIIAEMNGQSVRYNVSEDEFLEWLRELDYWVGWFDADSRRLFELSSAGRGENIVAVPQSRVQAIETAVRCYR